MSFSTLSLTQFLDRLASAEPTPGGGTAAAVAGAMGTALLIMVAGLPKTRANTDEERAALAGVRERLVPIREALERAADADARAFDEVLAAFRLPKTTDEEQGVRKAAIQRAMGVAIEVPLETLRLAADALDLAGSVARHGVRSASSDVRVATGLLLAAAEGGAANVRVNLGSVADPSNRDRWDAEAGRLSARAAEAGERARAALA
ncbi:MAG: cyclodeaminase/cyclohydrolase family protein [Acidobacteria bacterium]|nr:cyclodeaminase/cyclohydrolase family protein [Acidobacteriota bacterium]